MYYGKVSPDTPRRRLPRQVREQQMLDAAVEVFSERGFHAASMDEVAERARISKPLLYMYLGSKEDVFGACIGREADRLLDAIGAAVAARPVRDPGERLWLGLSAFFRYVAEHRASWTVLYQQARLVSGPVAVRLAQVRGDIVNAVTELVLQSTPDRGAGYARTRREASAIASALVGAADAMADWTLTRPQEEPEQTARRLMNLVWVGMERSSRGERYSPASASGAGQDDMAAAGD